jgi:predicted transcriptional regulator
VATRLPRYESGGQHAAALDSGGLRPYAWSMEVNLAPELQAKLTRLAADRGSDPGALVQEAIERMVDYDEWFVRELEKGVASADRDELIDHEDIGKLIESRYRG